MVPATLFSSMRLSKVESPAFVLVSQQICGPALILPQQSGERLLVFLDGEYRFKSINVDEIDEWSGLVCNDIEFRVSPDAFYETRFNDKLIGSFVRRGPSLYICCNGQGMFREQVIMIEVVNDLEGKDAAELGFTQWSVVSGEEPRAFCLFSHDAKGAVE